MKSGLLFAIAIILVSAPTWAGSSKALDPKAKPKTIRSRRARATPDRATLEKKLRENNDLVANGDTDAVQFILDEFRFDDEHSVKFKRKSDTLRIGPKGSDSPKFRKGKTQFLKMDTQGSWAKQIIKNPKVVRAFAIMDISGEFGNKIAVNSATMGIDKNGRVIELKTARESY